MKSWESLPASKLKPCGRVAAAFIARDIEDYRSAARYLRALAYGRNSSRTDPLAVLREKRGTCSTKHALLARLAAEQQLPIRLMLGIYEMSERNTPGVGRVLEKYGLACVPEAHCYLMYDDDRIDITRAVNGAEPIAKFLHEEVISPDQIADYKVAVHQRFLRNWIDTAATARAMSLDAAWKIREECIAALAA
jgi:Transglutaminase-like superfamily